MEELLGSVLGKYGSKALQYDASEGWGPLREALVPHLAARHVQTTSDGVLIMSGSQSLLDGIGKEPSSRPVITSRSKRRPTWARSRPSTPTNRATSKSKPTKTGSSPSLLKRCSPASASSSSTSSRRSRTPLAGRCRSPAAQQVADILKRHETLLVEDDPYSDLRYSGEPVPPIKSLAPENVAYSTTLSKTFAPGLRIGVVSPRSSSSAGWSPAARALICTRIRSRRRSPLST